VSGKRKRHGQKHRRDCGEAQELPSSKPVSKQPDRADQYEFAKPKHRNEPRRPFVAEPLCNPQQRQQGLNCRCCDVDQK
jgi:hypothetical protein